MIVPAEQKKKIAAHLLEGGYILSDNDGTLAPFTLSPDTTVIPARTIAAIEEFQDHFGRDKFLIVTGRRLDSIQAVLDRSGAGVSKNLPILGDDGAVYHFEGVTRNYTTKKEEGFIKQAHYQISELVLPIADELQNVSDLVVIEYKINGVNINTNAIHAQHGAEIELAVRQYFQQELKIICDHAPIFNDQKCYTMHEPPGHGIEIRSNRITKRQGIANLIDENIIMRGAPLIILVDDLKRGGNDVEAASLVKDSGGMVVQVLRENPAQRIPHNMMAVAPDVIIQSPQEVASFFAAIMQECKRLKAPSLKVLASGVHYNSGKPVPRFG